jgi:YggT family protein
MMPLSQLIKLVFTLYSLAIVARALLPLFRVDPYYPVMRFLIQITEPVLAPLRQHIPPIGTLDITPMVALLLLWLLECLIQTILLTLYY